MSSDDTIDTNTGKSPHDKPPANVTNEPSEIATFDPDLIAKEFLEEGPKGFRDFNNNFRAIVCKDDSQGLHDRIRINIENQGSKLTAEQYIDHWRSDPEVVQGLKDVAKILGQPDSCDVPVSALPAPNTIATLPDPSKTRG